VEAVETGNGLENPTGSDEEVRKGRRGLAAELTEQNFCSSLSKLEIKRQDSSRLYSSSTLTLVFLLVQLCQVALLILNETGPSYCR